MKHYQKMKINKSIKIILFLIVILFSNCLISPKESLFNRYDRIIPTQIIKNNNHEYILIYKGEINKISDVYIAFSEDLKKYKKIKNITDDIYEDSNPYIFKDNKNIFWLIFVSRRENKHKIFITSSTNLEKWDIPREVQFEDANIYSPFMLETFNGYYVIGYTSQKKELYKLKLIFSKNGKKWDNLKEISFNTMNNYYLKSFDFYYRIIKLKKDKKYVLIFNRQINNIINIMISTSTNLLSWTKPKFLTQDRFVNIFPKIFKDKEENIFVSYLSFYKNFPNIFVTSLNNKFNINSTENITENNYYKKILGIAYEKENKSKLFWFEKRGKDTKIKYKYISPQTYKTINRKPISEIRDYYSIPICIINYNYLPGKHCIIYYPQHNNVNEINKIYDAFENGYECIKRRTGLYDPNITSIYIYNSKNMMKAGVKYAFGWSDKTADFMVNLGGTRNQNGQIHFLESFLRVCNIWSIIPHEYFHGLIEQKFGKIYNNIKWLDEGLANYAGYLSATSKNTPTRFIKSAHYMLANQYNHSIFLLYSNNMIPLDKLSNVSYWIKNWGSKVFDLYAISTTLTDFLIKKYKFQDIIKIFSFLKMGDDLNTALLKSLNLDLLSLQNLYYNYLLQCNFKVGEFPIYMNYLIKKYGINPVKKIYILLSQGENKEQVFKKVIGKSFSEFTNEFALEELNK